MIPWDFFWFALLLIGLFGWWLCLFLLLESKIHVRPVHSRFRVMRERLDSWWMRFEHSHAWYLSNVLDRWLSIGFRRNLTPVSFLALSATSGTVVALLGVLIGKSWWLAVPFWWGGVLLPTLFIYGKYMGVTQKARRYGFLPFLDVYKQAYISSGENIITAFSTMKQDCPPAMESILSWLNRRLHDGSSQREALREFADVLRFEWAHIFVNYLISGMDGEAESIVHPLSELQIEMHGAVDDDEERYTITQGGFYMVLIAIFLTILGIIILCYFYPPMQRFYFQSDIGRMLLSTAGLIWLMTSVWSYLYMRKGGNL